MGNALFSKGALYQILRSRIHLGETGNKGITYPGDHDAITNEDLFEQVHKTTAPIDGPQRTE